LTLWYSQVLRQDTASKWSPGGKPTLFRHAVAWFAFIRYTRCFQICCRLIAYAALTRISAAVGQP
jgi:hypothetical protein